MAKLTACIITFNEEMKIEDCIKSLVPVADEIVIVDSGSTDHTVDIAYRYTENVYIENDWQGYGIQRQKAQGYATGDWILMIDADERVTPELVSEIMTVISDDDRNRVYAVPRLSWCFGRFIRHGGWYPDYVARLYPRGGAMYGDEQVHEKLHYGNEMKLLKLKGDLLHYTYNDLHHYLVKSAGYAREWAIQRERRGKTASLAQGAWHALACFLRMYLLRAGFLDGRTGLLLALLSAHSTFVKYADLWLRRQPSVPDRGDYQA